MTNPYRHGRYLSAVDPHRQENTVTAPNPTASTPEPVVKAAALWGSLSALFITGIGVLVSVGALSTTDAELYYSTIDSVSTNLVPVGSSIVGIVGLISGIVSPLVAAFVARRKVTPVVEAPVRTVVDGPKAGEL